MAAHIAHKIRLNAPLHETPLATAALEAVVIPTADDGLQRKVGQRLQRGEVRTGDRGAGGFINLDGEIGRHVLCSWRAVVIGDHGADEHLLDGIATSYRAGAALKSGVRQQNPDRGKITVVDDLGVGRDEPRNRPVARFLVDVTHSARA